jgi:hypothetical protein
MHAKRFEDGTALRGIATRRNRSSAAGGVARLKRGARERLDARHLDNGRSVGLRNAVKDKRSSGLQYTDREG